MEVKFVLGICLLELYYQLIHVSQANQEMEHL